ncbi:MAG: DUF4438 domain-containing protein [Candidatus Omnitrophica bacterium]|nr:DUF4438 domain-containing protein [Candidatus Omnitrophota bacterium]
MKTNIKQLVKIAVQGRVANAMRFSPFELDSDGKPHAVPSVGGITYNVKVGDPAFGWAGDHIEPCVSCTLDEQNRNNKQAQAFQFLPCVGNEAVVVSGGAKGAKGTVTGHHGGVEHLTVDFADRDLRKMTLDDKVLVRAYGQGLQLTDYPHIKTYNLDPAVLGKLGIKAESSGGLSVPVTALVPGALMGSGIGHADPGTGDYDITTQDPGLVKKHGLDKIRLGDLVALMDCDNTLGRHFYTGAVTIGIVIHSDSVISGHGPGVATLISTRKKGMLQPVIRSTANIGRILKIGRYREKN